MSYNDFFYVQTPKHKLLIRYFMGILDIKSVKLNKRLFFKMCKEGCVNFDKKYGCPPNSGDFSDLVKKFDKLFVMLFTLEMSQFDKTNYQEYLKLRIANSVLKSRIEKVMRVIEEKYNGLFFGSGACRLCNSCNKKRDLPCKYPKRRRPSLEAAGVDCNYLTKKLFDIPLQWYKDKKCPEYTSAVCGLAVSKDVDDKELEEYTQGSIFEIL